MAENQNKTLSITYSFQLKTGCFLCIIFLNILPLPNDRRRMPGTA